MKKQNTQGDGKARPAAKNTPASVPTTGGRPPASPAPTKARPSEESYQDAADMSRIFKQAKALHDFSESENIVGIAKRDANAHKTTAAPLPSTIPPKPDKSHATATGGASREVNEQAITVELAKVAAMANEVAGAHNYCVSFVAEFDSKGRLLKNSPFSSYEIECGKGPAFGASSNGKTPMVAIRRLIMSMDREKGLSVIKNREDEIRRLTGQLANAQSMLTVEKQIHGMEGGEA